MGGRAARAKELFGEALERPAAERADFARRACAGDEALAREVARLLAAHAAAEQAFPDPELPAGERPGDHIGAYKLLEMIGEGGFGTVWMAEQQKPIRRRVALKVVKWGMDTRQVVARFEAERQALALMDHPHIARVFDAGSTATGRPYFVMELVRGVPITRYCDEAQLTPRERIELLLPVCEAMQHAHQKGVIHRDLKPGNVLVTLHDARAVPKVIDFGIAKATAGQLTDKTVFTGFRQTLGTPEYMAPEQAEMSGLDVDTRADIYSLGVLLYELLTGTKPFELKEALAAGWLELLRRIREVDPDKPSTRVSTLGVRIVEIAARRRMLPKGLCTAFRGDLDWIVVKAMEKERGRRYETAHALAEDLLRHLHDEPVQASPPSRTYRLRKYLRRHRIGAAAATAVILSLLAGAGAAAWGYVAATRNEAQAVAAAGAAFAERQAALVAETEARREAAKSRQVVELLQELFAASNPYAVFGEPVAPQDLPARAMLDEATRALAENLRAEPEVEATLRLAIARSYIGLGLPTDADPHLARAAALLDSTGGPGDLVADHGALLGAARLEQGRWREAETLLRRSLAQEDGAGAGTTCRTASALDHLAHALAAQGRFDEAERSARQALAIQQQVHGAEHLHVATGLHALARVLLQLASLEEAEQASAAALAMSRRLAGPDHPLVVACLNTRGMLLLRQGRAEEAETTLRGALEQCTAVHGPGPHVQRARVLDNLGGTLVELSRRAEGEQFLREALAMNRKLLGADHPGVATSLNNLAVAFDQHRGAEKEVLLREALALRRRDADGDQLALATVLANLGSAVQHQGRRAEAEALQREAIAVLEAALPADHLRLGLALDGIGRAAYAAGDAARAETLFARVVAILRRHLGETDARVADALTRLGHCATAQGRHAEAAERHREALAIYRHCYGERHRDVASCLYNLATVLRRAGKHDVAEPPARESLALRRTLLGDADPAVARSMHLLARVLDDLQRFDEAEALARQALQQLESADGAPQHLLAARLYLLVSSLCMKQSRFADCEVAARAEVRHRRAASSTPDAGLAESIEYLAVTLRRLPRDRWPEAVDLLREAVAIRAPAAQPGEPALATARRRLRDLLRDLDRGDDADDVARDLLADEIAAFAPADPRFAESLIRRAWLHHDLGERAPAEAALRQAVELRRATDGADPPDAAAASEQLCLLLEKQGPPAQAVAMLQDRVARARSTDVARLGPLLARLAEQLLALDQAAAAESAAREALDCARRLPEPAPRTLAARLDLLCRTFLQQESFAAAEPAARECLSVAAVGLGETWQHRAAMALLGRSLAGQGRLAEAEPLLREAAEKMDPPRDRRNRLREAMQWLGDVYARLGDAQQAEHWRAKATALGKASGCP